METHYHRLSLTIRLRYIGKGKGERSGRNPFPRQDDSPDLGCRLKRVFLLREENRRPCDQLCAGLLLLRPTPMTAALAQQRGDSMYENPLSLTTSTTEITVFENDQFGSVRTIIRDGEPWFVAADVCRALDIQNTADALS